MADAYMPEMMLPGNLPSTPEQVKQLREYAEQLQRASVAPTSQHWTGVLAQALMGLRGGQVANQATGLQKAGIQSATQQDPNLAMLYSRGLLGNPSAPQANSGDGAGGNALKAAILMQESGNNSNIRPSVSGAIGPGQVMPNTFASVARPGESISNPDDNRAVSGRLLDGYMEKYGDPARAAVAYFSGPGNVAPPGSPTPWIADRRDPNGKSVSSYVADVSRRMGGPQMAQNNPSYSNYQHNPWANPAEQELARGMVKPTPGADVYGQPTVTSPMGGQRGLPVSQGAMPGVMVPATVGAEGSVSTQIPLRPPSAQGTPGQSSLQQQLQPLLDTGKNFSQQMGVTKATREQQAQDVNTAYQSIPIRQTLRAMKDDIVSHGDKMVWGPTSEWVTNLKRAVAQHAPGFFSPEDIKGIASADSFEKLSAQIQTMIGRMAGGTDLSLLQGMKSVPGAHNSKEGAIALIDMLDQIAGLNTQFMAENQGQIGQANYMQMKNDFFNRHQITNPITKNPIALDLGKAPQAGNQTKVINGKTYTKIDGKWHEGM